MSTNFLRRTKLTPCTGVVKSTAAASSNFGTQIDMQGYDGVCITAVFNCTAASTGTAVLTVVGTDTSTAASTNYTAITGASVTVVSSTAKASAAATSRTAIIDLSRPRYRYLRTKVVRKTKLGIGAIIAQQYDPRMEPVSYSTAVTTLATTAYATANILVIKQTT